MLPRADRSGIHVTQIRCHATDPAAPTIDALRIIAIGRFVIVPKEKATAREPILLSPRHDAGTRETSTQDDHHRSAADYGDRTGLGGSAGWPIFLWFGVEGSAGGAGELERAVPVPGHRPPDGVDHTPPPSSGVSAAETGEVVQVGGSAVSPMLHMMKFGPIHWHIAPGAVTQGSGTSAIADFGGPALGVGR